MSQTTLVHGASVPSIFPHLQSDGGGRLGESVTAIDTEVSLVRPTDAALFKSRISNILIIILMPFT